MVDGCGGGIDGGGGGGRWASIELVACDDDCDDELLVHGPPALTLDGGSTERLL